MKHIVHAPPPDFRPDLQGLRAIAVSLVLIAHANLGIVSGGFVGVDVFFVLSGYLITRVLLEELEATGKIRFLRFYARRLRRLLPALLVMLGASSAIAIWLLSGAEARAQLASAPFAATWTSNIYFALTKFEYFDELASRDIFLHTWSLGVEEQFYLLWPVLLLVLCRFRRLCSGMLVTFGVSLTLSLHWTLSAPESAFYQMPSRVWQLSLGALVCLLCHSTTVRARSLSNRIMRLPAPAALSAGLLLVFGSAMGLHPDLAYPGFWALAPSLGAALVVLSGHTSSALQHSPLSHPTLVWLGDRSYSLYLWHWPIFVLGSSLGLQNQVAPMSGLVALSLLAAVISYRLVEFPIWKGRFSTAAPSRAVLAGVLVTGSVVIGLDHAMQQLPTQTDSGEVSNQWRHDIPLLYGFPCDDWHESAEVRPCMFGQRQAKKTVLLLGDSIGVQWFTAIVALFPRPDWRVLVLTKSSCSMVDEEWFYRRLGRNYDVCTQWRTSVLEQLSGIGPDVVVVGNATSYGFTEEQWVEGSARVLERLSSGAGHVFLVPGTPVLGFDGPGCVARNLSADGQPSRHTCVATDSNRQVAEITGYLNRVADRFLNVHLLDLNDLVCPHGICDAVDLDGDVVFRDSHHVTDSFVRKRTAEIGRRIDLHLDGR